MKSWSILLFLQVRHKFELTFLEVSAKNKQLFFFKSLPEQNITSALTGVKEPIGALGSFFNFLLMHWPLKQPVRDTVLYQGGLPLISKKPLLQFTIHLPIPHISFWASSSWSGLRSSGTASVSHSSWRVRRQSMRRTNLKSLSHPGCRSCFCNPLVCQTYLCSSSSSQVNPFSSFKISTLLPLVLACWISSLMSSTHMNTLWACLVM